MLGTLDRPGVNDLAFIGSASNHYEWVPSRIVDFDCFVFVDALTGSVGAILESVRIELERLLDDLCVDFEMRVIRGAYKPDRTATDRPVVLAHLGVFTEASYRDESVTKRWSWRKYPCVTDVGRLARLAPPRPRGEDLLASVRRKLSDIRSGVTLMVEWTLPSLATRVVRIDASSPTFVEFCYGAASSCARHHARTLGHPEADRLGTDAFGPWYHGEVFETSSFLPLMELKARSRNDGFSGLGPAVRVLTKDFLEALEREIPRGVSH